MPHMFKICSNNLIFFHFNSWFIYIKIMFPNLTLGRAGYWEKEGQKYLHASLRLPKIETVAKNVIFFLGDGMGISTVTATRILKGQLKNKGGEDELLVFDQFPFVSFSKVSNSFLFI